MRIIILGAVAAVALTGPVSAESDLGSANYMLPGCRSFMQKASNYSDFDQGVCVGVIRGIVYAARDICAPTESTTNQAVAVVIKYIDQRPQDMHLPFAVLAHTALQEVWPCER
jgi:hypothetical protein